MSDSNPSSQPRPGTQSSQPSASHYMPELPYAEELQAMLEGRYLVESFLGQGGMGAVYKGLQLPLKRPVAIKILAKRGDGVEDEFAFEERFKREAYAMAALTHPHIVQVYDCGDAGENWLFISMELVEGGDLSDAIKAGTITPEVALKVIPQICDGLQAAHDRGIVHRDIKPANIFMTKDGRAKVADFGLAKKFDVKSTFVTKTGMGMGTPDYAAPEQYEGVSDIDHRADIYALGVMMYQMITGSLPRGNYKPASARVAVDPRVDAVLAKAMEPDRAERYQSTGDIKNDLKQIATKPVASQPATHTSAVPIVARPTTTGRQISKPVMRQPGATSAVPMASPSVTAPTPEKKKPNFIIIGSIAAVVIGLGVMFAMKGSSEPEKVTVSTKTPPPTPSTTSSSVTTTKPPAPKPTGSAAPLPQVTASVVSVPVPAGSEQWVDGLAQWFGVTKKNEAFAQEKNGEARAGNGYSTMTPVPTSVSSFRDQVARARWRPKDDRSEFKLCVRHAVDSLGKEILYSAKVERAEQRVRLGCNASEKKYQALVDYKLPPDFDYDAVHTLELRVVGDLLTVKLDGKRLGERRDTQLSEGHPAVAGKNLFIESFEYASLDPGGSAPVVTAPATPAKSGDTVTFGGHIYQFVAKKLSWTEGKETAVAMGGHLATITSKEEDDFLRKTFYPNFAKDDDYAFIGGIATPSPKWSWVTDEEFAYKPEGISGTGGMRMLSLSKGGGTLRWKDQSTGTRGLGVIVEWDDEKAMTAPAAVTTSPGDVLAFGEHRYQLVMEKLDFREARSKAEAMGGHLATITSKEENEWVQKSITIPMGEDDHILLGANRNKQGVWHWVSGEPVDLAMWGRTGPDGSGSALSYVARSSRWDDVNPSNPYPFLVEWDAPADMKPASVAAPATLPPAASLSSSVNLLSLVDVKRDAVEGAWESTPEGLAATKNKGLQLLGFNHAAPEEYDYEIEFTITGGNKEVSQLLPVPGNSIMWKMGMGGAAERGPFCFGPSLDGDDATKNTARTEALIRRARLTVGQRYRSLVEVRKGSLRALIDGDEVLKWSGDLTRLSYTGAAKLPNPTQPGISTYGTSVVFHKAELRPPSASPVVAAIPAPPAVIPSTPKTEIPSPPSSDPRLAQLEAGFKTRYEADAQKPFEVAVASLNQSYAANGIARTRAAAQAKGNLPEVTALDAEKAAIEGGKGVPAEDAADTPESLKTLRVTYRTALAKVTAERDARAAPLYDLYAKALDGYIAELTKANKTEDAQQVKALRESIAAKGGAGSATPSSPAPASGSTPTKPAASASPAADAPKMSEREVAEWLISLGEEVKILGGGKEVTVRDTALIPAGKITIKVANVKCSQLTNQDLTRLASARDLETLNLRENLPSDAVINLDPLRGLSKLNNLTCYAKVDSAGVDIIAGLSALTSLVLDSLPEGSLEKLAALKDLEDFESVGITGPGIAALKACKKLRRIQVRGSPCPVTDEDVRAIVAAVPDLEALHLGDVRNSASLSNACVSSVVELKSLNFLSLNAKDIDDSVFESLAKHGKLATLSLNGSKVTGKGISALAKLGSLRELSLYKTPVTDAALDEIARIKSLKSLTLYETSASEAAIAKFKAALPGCTVAK